MKKKISISLFQFQVIPDTSRALFVESNDKILILIFKYFVNFFAESYRRKTRHRDVSKFHFYIKVN